MNAALMIRESVVVVQAPLELDRAAASGRWQFPYLRQQAPQHSPP